MTTAYINRIGTAAPAHDIHQAFVDWAEARLADPRARKLFGRMVQRAGIAHRWSVLPPTAGGGSPVAATLPDSADLITWTIGDGGFAMRLSGEVPGRITRALAAPGLREQLTGAVMAVHAGGRSILDAVEDALGLPPSALADSRAVLRDHGNMSSATLMFVLARLMARPVADGVAVAFGPGLAAEGFRFRSAP